MSETLKATVRSVVASLVTAALLFTLKYLFRRTFPRVLQWMDENRRAVSWFYLGGLALTAVLFAWWSLTSLASGTPFPVYGVVIEISAFVAAVILGYFRLRRLVPEKDIEDALVYVEFPNRRLVPGFQPDFDAQCASLQSLFGRVNRVRGFGLGSLGLAYVAKGVFDAYLTLAGTTLRNAVVAGALLVKEAGGRVHPLAVPHVVRNNTRVVAANPRVCDELRKMVKHA
jgi:hypothetical protein